MEALGHPRSPTFAVAVAARGARLDSFGIIPGLLLTLAIALAAFALRWVPGLSFASPMIIAVVIGIGFNAFFGAPRSAAAGTAFVLSRLLRLGVVLLGLQVTIGQLVDVGAAGFAAIAATLAATFVFTVWLGRVLGVDRGLTELMAAGTAICGASAIIATNTVTRARDEDVAYAVACVTLFGTITMLAYPVAAPLLDLGPRAYGFWSGLSIHEVAQAVAASFQGGQEAGELGTVAKLSRVLFLAPLVMMCGIATARRMSRSHGASAEAKVPMPWFVLGFAALVGLNSFVSVPAEVRATAGTATTFLLTMALAAMGLRTDISQLRARGVRPLLLGLAASLFISGFGLTMAVLAV